MRKSCWLFVSVPRSWRQGCSGLCQNCQFNPVGSFVSSTLFARSVGREKQQLTNANMWRTQRVEREVWLLEGVICTHRHLPSSCCGQKAASLLRLPLNATHKWPTAPGSGARGFCCGAGCSEVPGAPLPPRTFIHIGQDKPDFKQPWARLKWPAAPLLWASVWTSASDNPRVRVWRRIKERTLARTETEMSAAMKNT